MKLLISADLVDISDIDSPEASQDRPGPNKMKKTKKTKEQRSLKRFRM
jgi:hypothetical protein